MTVRVALQDDPYDILIGEGLLPEAGRLTASILQPSRCAIITDDHVASLHAAPLLDSLRQAKFEPYLITIPSGESSKSMALAASLCDRLIEYGLDRKSSLFALGGGVVGDLTGFVASLYFRGIPVIQIPTTVVAQVDSSIGGKTGVNSPLGKNLIGSFHQPSLVISDTALLSTLPLHIFQEGLAEVIKHAVIADVAMLDILPPERNSDLTSLIARNAGIKASIVAQDELEIIGTRALLNFGHTIGHAIESVAGYGVLSHGESIAIGMMAALDLSVRLAGLPKSDFQRVQQVIQACGLPTSLPPALTSEALIAALQRDKKFDSGAIRFILTKNLGTAFISHQVTLQSLREAIERLRK
jgi:3-dehydroquinate synthase